MFPLIYLLRVKVLPIKLFLVYLIDNTLKIINFPCSFSFPEKTDFSSVVDNDSCFSIICFVPECYVACIVHEPLPADVQLEYRIHPFYLMTIVEA